MSAGAVKVGLPQIWTAKVQPVADGDTVNVNIKKSGDLGPRGHAPDRNPSDGAPELQPLLRPHRRVPFHRGNRTARGSDSGVEEQGAPGRDAAAPASRGLAGGSGERSRSGRGADGSTSARSGGGGPRASGTRNGMEWAWNNTYAELSQFAARAGDGIWETDACGAGPDAGTRSRLKVKWDADDADSAERQRRVRPRHELRSRQRRVSLRGLVGARLRTAALHLPARVSLSRPVARSSVHTGAGARGGTPSTGGEGPPCSRTRPARGRRIGDGAYLFDPQGDLRARAGYPCRLGCSEPLAGKVGLDAKYKAPESIQVPNASSGPIDLTEYEVESSP